MDTVIDDLLRVERKCARAAQHFQVDPYKTVLQRVSDTADDFGQSWSRSWIGYQARVYYEDFDPVPVGAHFSIEWGPQRSTGNWEEHTYDAVVDEILRRAGNPDLEQLQATANMMSAAFSDHQQELLATLDAVLADKLDQTLASLRVIIAELPPYGSQEEILQSYIPNQVQSRDRKALEGGVQTPPHIGIKCQVLSIGTRSMQLLELERLARQGRRYLEKRVKMTGGSVARKTGTIFIGHGHSPAWRDLKDFLQDRLKLTPDEFNLSPAAGLTTPERLTAMLDSAAFAFLVMTAEDEHGDTKLHARDNVIHEVGLFQGRLGFKRAIVLLEEGCAEFSNIEGLGQIRFPKGNIKAKSEEIRQVLEREGLLP